MLSRYLGKIIAPGVQILAVGEWSAHAEIARRLSPAPAERYCQPSALQLIACRKYCRNLGPDGLVQPRIIACNRDADAIGRPGELEGVYGRASQGRSQSGHSH